MTSTRALVKPLPKLMALMLVMFGALASNTLPHRSTATSQDNLATSWTPRELALIDSLRLFSLAPLPESPSNRFANNKQAAQLGEQIFSDPRFSSNGLVSCASCHQSNYNFTDNKTVAEGVGKTNRRSMPTVGMAYQHWFFWDGRADSLWSQTLGPLENPVEHGITRTKVAQLVQQHYAKQYQEITDTPLDLDFLKFSEMAMPFSEGSESQTKWESLPFEEQEKITQVFVNTGKFLAAFLRTVNPEQTTFDQFADRLLDANSSNNQKEILTQEQQLGLKLFLGKGSCINCHNGVMFSNNEFHHAGTPDNGKLELGRAEVLLTIQDNEFGCLSKWSDADKSKDCLHVKYLNTRVDIMQQAFKTPSLRNVATRPPYMHAGQFQTLKEVLKHYQTVANTSPLTDELFHGELSDQDLVYLEQFLMSLSSQ
ncbi:cytochrome-c peroxidase [Vibrio breoganii]|uniref:cytochrome-c peroxidase n=1 Tax=Vibrio breoganii TaxID=553239 RepID=UPI0012FFFEC7|nr:cytochrome c peroxidase [Vibrio breoganii]